MTTEQATISQGRKFSGIWIIPLLALAMGLYMVVHTWMTEGPEIEIAFSTADGLEEGKTKVKYRNVNMGLVESVHLNDKFDGVIATVKLDRQALPLLREDTHFWVVTARVGMGNISGLDTLLSGAYIQIAPGTGKKDERSFVALEQPPLTPTGAAGIRLRLVSDSAASITAGDAVLYNQYKVGRVEKMTFDVTDRKAHYTLFIDAPYHKLVDSHTRFWDISGVSLSAGADGFKLQTGSLETVLLGGVAFAVPPNIDKGSPVEDNAEFILYPSYGEILKNPYRYGSYFVVSFSQSVKGLEPGAPVEYRGIRVGRVERVMLKESLEYNAKMHTAGQAPPIPVLIFLEPGRMAIPDEQSSIEILMKTMHVGVANGMRASLETGSFLTGAKYVNIDYFKDTEQATMGKFLEYTTIPTIETGLGQIEQKITAALDKFNALQLDTTVNRANTALATLNESLVSLAALMENQSTQQLPKQLDETLAELRATLRGLSPDSELYQSIDSSLLRLNRTLGNMESLTRTLSEQPNAAILPSTPIADPIPEVKQ